MQPENERRAAPDGPGRAARRGRGRASSEDGGGGGPARPWEALAADAVGRVIEFWGFKHNQGRVWALLYLRGTSMTAAEIQSALDLSKGAVSMVTRELEQWEVIHRERTGSQPWRFRAEQELLRMVTRVITEREIRLVRDVRQDLGRAESAAREDATATREHLARLKRMRLLADLVERALTVFLKTAHLDASSFREVLRASRRKP
jgi:HTH-type transcriptional regulator, glycine betaine synthesis regulator